MVLERNPNFRGETYPTRGRAGRRARPGCCADAGKPMPFIDEVVFTLEKEGIPYWNKFLQGYYDSSGISSDNFDQAVRVDVERRGEPHAGDGGAGHPAAHLGRHHASSTSASTCSIRWSAALGERARKLRQAISIAID